MKFLVGALIAVFVFVVLLDYYKLHYRYFGFQ